MLLGRGDAHLPHAGGRKWSVWVKSRSHGVQKMVCARSGPKLMEQRTPRSTASLSLRRNASFFALWVSPGYRRKNSSRTASLSTAFTSGMPARGIVVLPAELSASRRARRKIVRDFDHALPASTFGGSTGSPDFQATVHVRPSAVCASSKGTTRPVGPARSLVTARRRLLVAPVPWSRSPRQAENRVGRGALG